MAIESTSERIEQLLSVSRAIYVIDSGGILLHHEFFMGQDDDPNLYSGLFSAVNVFSKELDSGPIRAINLDNYKFIFNEDLETNYLIVLDVNTEMLDNDGVWLLQQIMKRFDAMKNLLEQDFKGSLTLETLFDERGKEINWNTIHMIREDAISTQKSLFDKVDTLNLTRINLKNRTWVKIRKIIATTVEHQIGLIGAYFFIDKNEHKNVLYSGRDREKLEPLYSYMMKKSTESAGIELEMERINLEPDIFCSIYPFLMEDGGILAIASEDKYLIARLNNQMERIVASLEKIGMAS